MKTYRADLHVHTVLSPCGDLDMGPVNIIREARKKQLDIIAITDHNHTGHSALVARMAAEADIWVVYGVEVTTKEEVHCLAFFESVAELDLFQSFIDGCMPVIENDPLQFGEQLLVDEKEHVVQEIKHSLYPGIDADLNTVAEKVRELDGLFVPAHVDRPFNGLYAQLGFLPEDLFPDAIEISKQRSRSQMIAEHPELKDFALLENSDAHVPGQIGQRWNQLLMSEKSFPELRLALHCRDGRKVMQS